jgi:3-amino-4-hydroxybenzoic acid synthase
MSLAITNKVDQPELPPKTPGLTSPKMNQPMRVVDRAREAQRNEPILWCDASQIGEHSNSTQFSVIERALQANYSGVVLRPDQLHTVAAKLPSRATRILQVDNQQQWQDLAVEQQTKGDQTLNAQARVIASRSVEVLDSARAAGFETCYRTEVNSAELLYASYSNGRRYDYLCIRFEHSTNIPLELVLAELHTLGTRVIKETSTMEDAVISLGVLEMGSQGVMLTPQSHEELDELKRTLTAVSSEQLPLEVGTIIRTKALGMGYRSCIDTTTLFAADEGILVGSTSGGGILCCPEVFHLPYMELRPFRVNAGAVHSYVFNSGNRTDYMSELKAGSPVMLVRGDGRTRVAYVGRIKTEVRPLRLLEVAFGEDHHLNVIMQDDWHVRIFSEHATPLNITELKPGDKVLGFVTDPGRHVGIKVDEHILER